MPATAFTAARHGFHFANSFVNPVVTIPGYGTINTYGLCGGMSYASLDAYFAGSPIPTHEAPDLPAGGTPPVGSRLQQWIYDRQLSSFDPFVNPSVVKFVTQALPIGRTAYEVTWQDEWPLIAAEIDAGRPCPIGLIAPSTNPANSHQVVAISYDTSAAWTLGIYDCNYPDAAVTLVLDDASQTVLESTGDTWVGFFLEGYQAGPPRYVDLVLSSGIDTNPAPPATAALGDLVEVGFRVRNDGDYTAHLTSLDASMRGPAGEDLDSMFAPDGIAGTLAPGAEQAYLGTASPFGTTAGTYEVVPWYQTRQGEWMVVPAGAPGTRMSTTLDAL